MNMMPAYNGIKGIKIYFKFHGSYFKKKKKTAVKFQLRNLNPILKVPV